MIQTVTAEYYFIKKSEKSRRCVDFLLFFESAYKGKAEEMKNIFSSLNGKVDLYPCCDTLQVKDYSRFNMAGFDEAHKKQMRETQFPRDLERAFSMGAELGRNAASAENVKKR